MKKDTGSSRKSICKTIPRPALCAAVLCAAALALFLLCGPAAKKDAFLRLSEPVDTPSAGGLVPNPYGTLSVPTQITKIGGDYFLVDCYHNQILTSTSPETPLTDWLVVTDQIDRGHTIAGDGVVYLADDTENNRILVLEKKDGLFYLTQTFSDVGVRPHYVVYNEADSRFYALSSMTGELYVFRRPSDGPQVALEKILSIPGLDGVYVRSFTIDGSGVYFVSGDSAIHYARLRDLQIERSWPVPEQIAGMIQLTPIGDDFYITVSTDLYGDQSFATILRVSDLDDLQNGRWEDLYDHFIGGGTPYYITRFDGHYYLTEHRVPGHFVWEFDVEDGEPVHVRALQ